jgi:hypothetical protein
MVWSLYITRELINSISIRNMDDECSDWDDMLYLIRFLLDESLLLESGSIRYSRVICCLSLTVSVTVDPTWSILPMNGFNQEKLSEQTVLSLVGSSFPLGSIDSPTKTSFSYFPIRRSCWAHPSSLKKGSMTASVDTKGISNRLGIMKLCCRIVIVNKTKMRAG